MQPAVKGNCLLIALGHPIGASSIPVDKGIPKGNRVLLCLGCSEGIVFPFDRKNPKKPAVSWHTTFLGKSSVLYLCGADSSRNCSTPRKVWLQLRRSGGKGCPLRGSISDRKRLAGGADMHCLPAVSSAEQRYIKALRQPLLTIVSEPPRQFQPQIVQRQSLG